MEDNKKPVQEKKSTSEEKKGIKLDEKSKMVRKVFCLTDGEHVIQNYKCGFAFFFIFEQNNHHNSKKRNYTCSNIIHPSGTMYITERHILWIPNIVGKNLCIPILQIKEVKKESTKLVIPNGIGVLMKDNVTSHHFGDLLKRNETFNILVHLMAHPVTLIKPLFDEEDELESIFGDGRTNGQIKEEKRIGEVSSDVHEGLSEEETRKRLSTRVNASSPIYSVNNSKYEVLDDTHQKRNTVSEKNMMDFSLKEQKYANKTVDTETTKNILRKINESKESGTASLEELQRQEKVLNNIENKLDSIDTNLSISNRQLKNIEGIKGRILNLFRRNPKQKDDEMDELMKNFRGKCNLVEIDILYKFKNDTRKLLFFSPCFLAIH